MNRGGYGLGLSIAKRIITNLHGDISVNSIVDKGTTFIITLPTI
jgi:signal transduction histidine kinase